MSWEAPQTAARLSGFEQLRLAREILLQEGAAIRAIAKHSIGVSAMRSSWSTGAGGV